MHYVVGLTGGIGSGKTTIGYLFSALGVPVVDADVIARDCVKKGSPLLTSIKHHFGESIIDAKGELNRTQLRQQIFHHPEEKKWLENLLHPAIYHACQQQLLLTTAPYTLLIAPLLLETKLHTLCQSILVIDAPEKSQITRASLRDNTSPELIKKMISTQLHRQERLKWATEIIRNDKPLDQHFLTLAKNVQTLHHHYLTKSSQLK